MAYRTVQQSLTEKQTKLKKILDIPDDDNIAANAQEMQDRFADGRTIENWQYQTGKLTT